MGLAVLPVQLGGDLGLNCHHERMRGVFNLDGFSSVFSLCSLPPSYLLLLGAVRIAVPVNSYERFKVLHVSD